MKYIHFKELIKSDLFRYSGHISCGKFFRYFFTVPGFKYSFFIRCCSYLRDKKCMRYLLYPFAKVFYLHYSFKYGISIPFTCSIGKGLYIGHFGGIVVHHKTVIGRNCNISHCVTIGTSARGERKGCPKIGDYVYIGPGAKIFGAITIGDNVAIGANCVVNKDIPDNSVVVGVPGKIISSSKGSTGCIIRTDY